MLAWQSAATVRISQIIQAAHGQGYDMAIVFLLSHIIPDNQNLKLAPWILLLQTICLSLKTLLQDYELVSDLLSG